MSFILHLQTHHTTLTFAHSSYNVQYSVLLCFRIHSFSCTHLDYVSQNSLLHFCYAEHMNQAKVLNLSLMIHSLILILRFSVQYIQCRIRFDHHFIPHTLIYLVYLIAHIPRALNAKVTENGTSFSLLKCDPHITKSTLIFH